MKWTITLLSRHFGPLRRMNWGEDLLFNRIKVKLKCPVFILSNIFSHSDILDFQKNLFPIVPPAKTNSCKSFNLKELQQQKFLCTADFSRILEKRANLPRRLNSIKVKRTSEALKVNIGNCRNVRGLGKSMVVFRLFEKLRYFNERSTKFESLYQE